jgi:hypothetical protein
VLISVGGDGDGVDEVEDPLSMHEQLLDREERTCWPQGDDPPVEVSHEDCQQVDDRTIVGCGVHVDRAKDLVY